jgi:hypothetical protein
MTELGATEQYLVDKVESDILKCIESCKNLLEGFAEMQGTNLAEMVIDAEGKMLLVTMAPGIEMLAQRLTECELVPMLSASMFKLYK